MGAAEAKSHFLAVAERVHATAKAVIVTKRGVPYVRVAPLERAAAAKSILGCMKETAHATGDSVGPEPDEWDALA